MTPKCHFKEMEYYWTDGGNGTIEEWFECTVCGHTKSLGDGKG